MLVSSLFPLLVEASFLLLCTVLAWVQMHATDLEFPHEMLLVLCWKIAMTKMKTMTTTQGIRYEFPIWLTTRGWHFQPQERVSPRLLLPVSSRLPLNEQYSPWQRPSA